MWRASGVGHAGPDGSEAVSAALRSVSSESCCDAGGSGDSCMLGAPCLASCGRWSEEGAAASCRPEAPARARRRHVRVECMILQERRGRSEVAVRRSRARSVVSRPLPSREEDERTVRWLVSLEPI